MSIKFWNLNCVKIRGGKKSLWSARLRTEGYGKPHSAITKEMFDIGKDIRGAGNTAENAIKDFQKQYRAKQARLNTERNADTIPAPPMPLRDSSSDYTFGPN